MTPQEMDAARKTLGLPNEQMGRLLGLTKINANNTFSLWSRGLVNIDTSRARLMQAYLDGYRPADWDAPNPDLDLDSIEPDQVQHLRDSLGLSNRQFCDMLGISAKRPEQTVSNWARNIRNMNGARSRLLNAYLEGYRPADWPLEDELEARP